VTEATTDADALVVGNPHPWALVPGNAEAGLRLAHEYSERHGIESADVLTVHNDDRAGLLADLLVPHITGKTVVEIGGGVGLLACHMGRYAKHVYCIEANPAWTWEFLGCIYRQKPKNVSYLFGAADEFAGLIRADVAVIATHSGREAMKAAAAKFAPEIIDLYGEPVAS